MFTIMSGITVCRICEPEHLPAKLNFVVALPAMPCQQFFGVGPYPPWIYFLAIRVTACGRNQTRRARGSRLPSVLEKNEELGKALCIENRIG